MSDNMNNIKGALDAFVAQQKDKVLKQSQPELVRAVEQVNAVGQEVKNLAPLLQDISNAVRQNTSALQHIEVKAPDVHVDAPIVNVPDIKVPTPQVTVHVPQAKAPIVNIPENKYPESMKIHGFDWKNPLPVILTDIEGRPYTAGWFGGSGGGTKAITDLQQLAGYPISSNNGTADNGTLRVVVATDSGVSVSISGSTGSIAAALVDSSGVQYSGSNPLPTTATLTLPSGPGDAATATRILQAGDSVSSISIVSNIATLDVKQMSGDVSSTVINSILVALDVKQVSGDVSSTVVNSILSPIAQGDSASALRIIQAGDSISSISITSQPTTLDVQIVSGAVSSINLLQVGGSGVVVGTGYQDNALRVVNATDAVTSMQAKAIARTTNPAAATDATSNFVSSDKIGRQLNRPVQVRELLTTAYLVFTSGSAFGTETSFKASPASTYLDLIFITASNTSDAALSVDIRSETAAGIVLNLQVPASGTTGVAFPVPLPQNTVAATWTVDPPDITGTTLTMSGLFSQEV